MKIVLAMVLALALSSVVAHARGSCSTGAYKTCLACCNNIGDPRAVNQCRAQCEDYNREEYNPIKHPKKRWPSSLLKNPSAMVFKTLKDGGRRICTDSTYSLGSSLWWVYGRAYSI